jgi:4'-phosphopantetheinyl transferase
MSEKWREGRPAFRLSPGDVHLWYINLAEGADLSRSCSKILSRDEMERAARFHFERHRRLFEASRAATRMILGAYLDMAPEKLVFRYAAKGKPELAAEGPESEIKFNVSHSRHRAILAVSPHQLGVDIEFVDKDFGGEEIARRFFSPAEVDTLLAVDERSRPAAFFDCWTRKEAYIKAVGEGLSLPLDSFDVAFGPQVPPALLRVKDFPEETARWRMYEIPAPAGYAAALVVAGADHQLKVIEWQWPIREQACS